MLARAILIAAALLAFPTASAAQEAPPSAQEAAEARALADTIISSNSADAFFVNKTRGAAPIAEHTPSRLSCFFTGSSGDRITIFPDRGNGVPVGRDVGCSTRFSSGNISTYATDFAGSPTIRENFEGAVDAIMDRWPDAKPYAGDIELPGEPGVEPALASAFLVSLDDQNMLTVVLVWDHKEWSYKLRATGPVDEADDLIDVAAALMTRIQRDVLEP